LVSYCWSHARRQFHDLAPKGKAPIAYEALRSIAALHALEAAIRRKTPAQRLAKRRARSRPPVEALFAWFEATLARLPARGTTADAIRYALHRLDPVWEQLFPVEQARIVRSLVERVVIGPAGADIRLRLDGLGGLVRDLTAISPDALRSAA